MIIDKDTQFKPVQRGVIISTKSIIKMSMYLINEKGYLYVLAGRLTSDCVENIFCSVKAKQPSPNSLQFKQSLKIIAVSEYLKPVGNFSYEEDDRLIAGNLLIKPKVKETKKVLPVPHVSAKEINLGIIELNILYNIAEYILSRISKYNISCKMCLNFAGSFTYNLSFKYAQFVQLKCFRRNTLFFVNKATFKYFHQMEIVIRQYLPCLKGKFDANKYDLVNFFKEKIMCIPCNTLKNCHNIKYKIMTRFIKF